MIGLSIDRWRVAGLAGAIIALALALIIPPALAQTIESFRDDFTSISYSGNSGTLNWSGPWSELGESNGPSSGSVRVVASDRCAGGSGNCLRIGSDGGDLSNHGVSRVADLDDAVSATLSYHYRRQTKGQTSGSVSVQISGDGGSSWTTLTSINLAGAQKASTASHDISGYMGSSTKVRFRGTGSGVDGYLYFDAISITAEMTVSGTTTTTTIAPTTTTTVAVTTTTVASTTTTTSTPGSSTTPTTTTGAETLSSDADPTTTAGNAVDPEQPDEPVPTAADDFNNVADETSTDQGSAPMSVVFGALADNALSGIALLILASGLVLVGVERKER